MREGSLEAPTRHPIDWQSETYWDQESLESELERVYDVCHGCRRCVSLCDSFPTLFDLVDESDTMEAGECKREIEEWARNDEGMRPSTLGSHVPTPRVPVGRDRTGEIAPYGPCPQRSESRMAPLCACPAALRVVVSFAKLPTKQKPKTAKYANCCIAACKRIQRNRFIECFNVLCSHL